MNAPRTLDAGLLARSQHSEGPATDHLNTGFSWFPCVCLKTNAEMVFNIPSCHYMLSQFVSMYKITTASV